jgi:hypothetical protein
MRCVLLTHRSVSTLDRISFQLTGELFLYGMALSSRVSVSNDGATYSSTFAEFLHCDVYVSAGAGGSSGTPDDPFSDVQSALDAILVDAVATRPNADAEASSPSPRRRRRASFGASSAAYDALGDVDRGAVDGAKPREWTNRDVIRLGAFSCHAPVQSPTSTPRDPN